MKWDDDMIQLLLKESAGESISIQWQVDIKSLSRAFLQAFISKNSNIMKVLLARGADVNEADANGRTPLMIAAHQGDLEQARFLLNANANVNAFPSREQTALILASSQGHLEMVDLLLNTGADLNAVTLKGTSPEMYSSLTCIPIQAMQH